MQAGGKMIEKIASAHGENPVEDRIIVGHYRDYAVIQDEIGKLFLIEDKNRILQSGELYMGTSLMPVSCLTVLEQEILYDQFGSEV